MARAKRAKVFVPSEIAVVHVISTVNRFNFFLGYDAASGKNFDHRKGWLEKQLRLAAASFGIDLITYALMSNHMHLILRSRPDVVKTWDDTEVARRWLTLCPISKNDDGTPKEPSEPELNSIRSDPDKVIELRQRLSDISWWMRLICQRVAQWANAEDQTKGKFWQNRYKAIRLLDEAAILACAAYVDLNPIRAAMAETLEDSQFTSVQRRVNALQQVVAQEQGSCNPCDPDQLPDAFLAPVQVADVSVQQSDKFEQHRDSRNAPEQGTCEVSFAYPNGVKLDYKGLEQSDLDSPCEFIVDLEVLAQNALVQAALDQATVERYADRKSTSITNSASTNSNVLNLKVVNSNAAVQRAVDPQAVLDVAQYPSVSGVADRDMPASETSQLVSNRRESVIGNRTPTYRKRCSDLGFASMSAAEYLQLLDWTARRIVPGKAGATPEDTPPLFARLQIRTEVWCELVRNFHQYFCLVAGSSEQVDTYRSRERSQRFNLRAAGRVLLST